jgi:hypothetical protein
MLKRNLFQQIEFEDAYKHNKEIVNIKASLVVKGLILISSLLLCTFFISYKPNQNGFNKKFNYSKGMKWSEKTLVATNSFPIYKNENIYNSEVKTARENARLVFEIDESYKSSLTNQDLFKSYGILNRINNFTFRSDIINSNVIINEQNNFKSLFDSISKLSYNDRQNIINISKDILVQFVKSTDKFIINYDLYKIKDNKIVIQRDNINRSIISKNQLIDSITLFKNEENFVRNKASKETQLISKLILLLSYKPDLSYSYELSKEEKELAELSVPKTIGIVKKGNIIVSKGQALRENHILALDSYYFSMSLTNDTSVHFTTYISNFGHISLIFSFIILYLYNIRKRIFYDNNQFGAIFVLFVITSLQAWVSVEYDYNYPMEFLIFLPAYSMLAAIVFDSRTAFYATVTMALLVASIRGNDYITAVIMMFSGSVAAYTVRDIQNRTQMLKSIFLIFSSFVLTIFTFGVDASLYSKETLQKLMLCAINSFFSPLITFGMLYFMEKTTNFSSNLIYQEYDNLNHPLLKKLNEVAPGTFQHVRGVASLSESCAEAIEANVLFVRVASFFHDIGKIEKPEYFVENQIDMVNKHDSIPAKRSAHIIIDHVNAGVKIAKQHKLPERIIDIIYMHHGTTMVKHFYAKALEENPNANPADYTYPGPKPNSKEAAIIMICDTAEAISRLGITDDDEMEQMLDKIIKERIEEGQFDDCDITIKDLQIIKYTILKNIKAVGHSRIAYKEIK